MRNRGLTIASLLSALCAVGLGGVCHAQSRVQTPWYIVEDGYKVDAKTFAGFRAWRAAVCERCHGAHQEGSSGPSLLDALKLLTVEQFKRVVADGNPQRGMPGYQSSAPVMANLENLYAYLKGRADGAITRPKVEALQ